MRMMHHNKQSQHNVRDDKPQQTSVAQGEGDASQ